MRRRLKVAFVAALASLMLLTGLGLSADPAAAATNKQIHVHCTILTAPTATLVYVFGTNQNDRVTSDWWGINLFGTASTVGWWWHGYANILISVNGGASWLNRGQFYLSGGDGSYWATINVPC
jgi:hypothetical protein